MTDNIHSCSYHCTRPACVLAQRDELRLIFLEAADRVTPTPNTPKASPALSGDLKALLEFRPQIVSPSDGPEPSLLEALRYYYISNDILPKVARKLVERYVEALAALSPAQAEPLGQAGATQAEVRPYDEAVEALRQALNALPRFSFFLDNRGNVRRVEGKSGNWIEWQQAHELFDTEVVDGLVAKERARAAITKATQEHK